MTINSESQVSSAAVFVLGCKVNQAEAAGMRQMLEDAGCRICGPDEPADIVIVNTCCVTSKAEAKSRRLVNRLSRLHPRALVLVTGCLAEINPASFDGSDGRILVYPQSHRAKLKRELEKRSLWSAWTGTQQFTGEFVDFGVPSTPTKAREFIKIQDGCSSNCSYCIVPRARGPERSLDAHSVLAHIEKMELSGVAEIVLTGVNLGAYGKDLAPTVNLEWLIRTALTRQPRVRFRLSSVEPEHITQSMVELMSEHDRLCNHFHVPVQSGDDRVLRQMNRAYDVSFVRALVKNILTNIPDACLGFDIIVGFPGETDEAFNRTVELLQNCQPSYLHVFPFSARPGTCAAKLPGKVPDHVIQNRVELLRELSSHLRQEFFKRCIGRAYSAVVESGPAPVTKELLVRTENYIPAYCPPTQQLLKEKRGTVELMELKDGRVLAQAL